MAVRKASKASFPQKVCFALMILFLFPWSLIYLFFWRGRCVYCGKRILFNKHVCKKCYRNSTAIVNEFDSKMETFFAQMGAVESIDDILGQYYYIIERIDGIEVIYDALDDEVDTESMKESVLNYLTENLKNWYKAHLPQFEKNIAYKNETLELIQEGIIQYDIFKDLLVSYQEKILSIKEDIDDDDE
ncbi:MAG: hypothetical protein KHY88_05290 [Erysipelotrichaceae bacterium]|nr:hypothetical protein [Erysipelotrichaceae bacterium]